MTRHSAEPKHLTREQIEGFAAQTLRDHGLFSIPVDPVLVANRTGIRVHNAKFAEDGIAGMVARRGDKRTILVNQSDPLQRKRFTIAHELGHHFLHLMEDDGEFVDTVVDLFRLQDAEQAARAEHRRREIQANQFGAALLMPAELLRRAHEDTKGVDDLAALFQVSQSAMAIRLSQLGLD